MESMNPMALMGQLCGFVALVMCVLAFANKNDDKLMTLLISANVAFMLQFVFLSSWTAAVLTALVIVRIALARRFPGSLKVMAGVLGASAVAAILTWQSPVDTFAVLAAALGTPAMFLLKGVMLRVFLGLAAFCWMMNNLLIGSIGGTLAEALVVVTNVITIVRLIRAQRRYPGAAEELER
ncbi:YgjV family protein [Vreelandella malpeensis]|uniref:YgjV family protein n=1 Tax=Vreelandella malpeensis TaxID=1172368 RepID=A0ABS8DPL0_9GAMM|nr:YgjV family protein [Halomonas malpeensis]MCB8888237.1 YgjV family protein [Halomonas malpeensis]